MRRVFIWLLCLLLVLPQAASGQGHVLTQAIRQGTCHSLTGDVQLMVLFLDTPDAQWDAESRSAFSQRIAQAVETLETEAAAYGAELALEIQSYHTQMSQTFESTDPTEPLLQGILHTPELRKTAMDTDLAGIPLLLCLAQEGRSRTYAATGEDIEYVILFSNAGPETIRHELLHLYGAQDFYIHDAVKATAKNRFPDSIMLSTDPANTVDSFTAWCIGWAEQPDAAASAFLADTEHISSDALEAVLADAMLMGFATLKKDNGVYSGMVMDGLPHGTGTFLFDDGTSYTGQWVNGTKNGQGVFQWPNGTIYTGDFCNGEQTGQGCIRWPDGTVYTGDFLNGEQTGQGCIRWPDGTVYTGDFLNGEQTGQGCIRWPDGTVYAGDFLNGEQTGQGCMRWPDGSVYTGTMLDGAYHGIGILTMPDGSVTAGLWAQGELIERYEEATVQ